MVSTCSVVGCKNRYGNPEIAFFRFPKPKKKRRAWIKAMNRDQWLPNEHSRICSVHFVDGWHSDDRHDVNYRPTLFPLIQPKKAASKKTATELIRESLRTLNPKSQETTDDDENHQIVDNSKQHLKTSLIHHSSYCLPECDLPVTHQSLPDHDLPVPNDSVPGIRCDLPVSRHSLPDRILLVSQVSWFNDDMSVIYNREPDCDCGLSVTDHIVPDHNLPVSRHSLTCYGFPVTHKVLSDRDLPITHSSSTSSNLPNTYQGSSTSSNLPNTYQGSSTSNNLPNTYQGGDYIPDCNLSVKQEIETFEDTVQSKLFHDKGTQSERDPLFSENLQLKYEIEVLKAELWECRKLIKHKDSRTKSCT